MKFSDFKIQSVSAAKIIEKYNDFTAEIKAAKSGKELIAVLKKVDRYSSNLQTSISIINVKYTLDVNNKLILKKLMKLDEELPLTSEATLSFTKALLDSPHLDDVKAKYGDYYVTLTSLELRTNNPSVNEERIALNQLSTQYGGITGSAQISFRDNVYNLSQMGKFVESSDRETRKESSFAVAKWYSDNNDQLGEIYDKMVKLRDQIAKKLGFKNFVELGYLSLSRTDYSSYDVAMYRKQIREVCVPLAVKIIEQQRKRIGVSHFYFYDKNFKFVDGNPTPNGNPEQLLVKAQNMYDELSPETSQFFKMMKESELLDVIARSGKTPGGYMTSFPKYEVPFIFANFNATKHDVEVLTHEVGHAFQYYLSRKIKPTCFISPTMESCEIHSMSMEFITWPWMKNFFDDVSKFKKSHLEDALTFIPYGALVDEFQHFVYENPSVTHNERLAKWRELEKQYLPMTDYENCDFLDAGGYWLRQSHIFEVPFYYIDYTLAQVVAFQFLVESQKNWEKAWKKYIRLCKMGGKYPFTTLLKKNHLRVPFDENSLNKTFAPLTRILKEF